MQQFVAPRMQMCTRCLRRLRPQKNLPYRTMATASAITPPASTSQMTQSAPPIARYPLNQPPSHKPPSFRKSQLHRQYTSLLRSTPLILLFSQFQLLSREWMAIRRELELALANTDKQQGTELAAGIKLQVIQTGIFESALRIADYYNPPGPPTAPSATDPANQSSNSSIPSLTPEASDVRFTHALSRHAHDSVHHLRRKHPLQPLLSGPLALLAFPSISPAHLKTALSILSPDKAAGFPAPTRRSSPGYWDLGCQTGMQKLMLVGARVEGGVYDRFGVQWLGGLQGMEGLRAELVGLLSSPGVGLVQGLEGAGKSVWLTMEGRRVTMEEDAGAKHEVKEEAKVIEQT